MARTRAVETTEGPTRTQRGFALGETLVSIVLVALIGTALIAATLTVVRSDAQHRALSQVSVSAQNVIDALTAAPYVNCASPADYGPTALDFQLEPDTAVAVDSVEYWNGQPPPGTADPTPAEWATAFVSGCSSDLGLQRITFTVTSSAGSAESTKTRSVLKRFNGSLPEPEPDPPPGGRTCEISATSKVASTWVNEILWEQDTNYSSGAGSEELNILYLDGTRRFSYLRFDVAPSVACENGGTLPAGATIVAAEVRLYTFNIGGLPACGANSCWHVMERVPVAWDQATLTWNNQPCPTGYGDSCQTGGTPSGILFEHGTGAFNWSARYQRIEAPQLLSDVQSFYNSPSTNHGWVIKEACAITYGKACGSRSPGFQMRSSRAPTIAERPTLIVHY